MIGHKYARTDIKWEKERINLGIWIVCNRCMLTGQVDGALVIHEHNAAVITFDVLDAPHLVCNAQST